MFKYIVFMILPFSLPSWSCELQAPVRHINSNGETGGLVDVRSKVELGAYIGFNASVCGYAVIENNAKVQDFAKIQDNAWIRKFSIIKDYAVVSGDVYIEGEEYNETIVKDYAKVTGNSKILKGSVVGNFSEISGSTELYSVTAINRSKICGSYIIKNEQITDDFYCNRLDSKAVITVINADTSRLNPIRNLRLILSEGHFHSTPGSHQIKLNEIRLTDEEFDVLGNEIFIKKESADGLNTITYEGLDEEGLRINSVEFDFMTSRRSIRIPIQPSFSNVNFETSVKYVLEGKEYSGLASVKNDEVVVRNIPEIEGGKVILTGKSAIGYFKEEFESTEVSPNIDIHEFSTLDNRNLDLSEGILGWDISHPESVSVITEGNERYFKIESSSSESIVIKKTVRLSKGKKKISIPVENVEEVDIEVAFYSHKQNELETFHLSQGSDLIPELEFSSEIDEDIVSLVIILKSHLNKAAWGIHLGQLQEKDYSIRFEPYDLSVFNNAEMSLLETYNDRTCRPSLEILEPEYEFIMEKLSYFSGGTNTMFPTRHENRIHGDLSISGIPKDQIASINLVAFQNSRRQEGEEPVFRVRLHKCSKGKWSNGVYRITRQAGSRVNLGEYMFSIGAKDLNKIRTKDGDTVNLYVEIVTQSLGGPYYSSHPKNSLPVFKVPELMKSYSYNVDDYDSIKRGWLKTGGDKWIDPEFSNILLGIIMDGNEGPTNHWMVNDISKSNGGTFKGHAGHARGDDVDVTFQDMVTNVGPLKFDFDTFVSPEHWEQGLSLIDAFLSRISGHFENIETIHVEVISDDRDTAPKGGKYVLNKFQSRCLAGRYIDYHEGKLNHTWQGSLLSTAPNHRNHMHIRFNNPKIRDKRKLPYPMTYPGVKLSDYKFELKSNGELKVKLKESTKFSNTVLLWRAHVDKEFKSNAKTVFNKIKDTDEERGKIPASWDDFYIYVTLGNKGNGGCTMKSVRVRKKNNSTKLLFLEAI